MDPTEWGKVAKKMKTPLAPPMSFAYTPSHAAGHTRCAVRRGGRVAEGARLERVYTGNRIEGSNPSLSAMTSLKLLKFCVTEKSCAASAGLRDTAQTNYPQTSRAPITRKANAAAHAHGGDVRVKEAPPECRHSDGAHRRAHRPSHGG